MTPTSERNDMRVTPIQVNGRHTIEVTVTAREERRLNYLAARMPDGNSLPFRGLMIADHPAALKLALRYALAQGLRNAKQEETATRLLRSDLAKTGIRFTVIRRKQRRLLGFRLIRALVTTADFIPTT